MTSSYYNTSSDAAKTEERSRIYHGCGSKPSHPQCALTGADGEGLLLHGIRGLFLAAEMCRVSDPELDPRSSVRTSRKRPFPCIPRYSPTSSARGVSPSRPRDGTVEGSNSVGSGRVVWIHVLVMFYRSWPWSCSFYPSATRLHMRMHL